MQHILRKLSRAVIGLAAFASVAQAEAAPWSPNPDDALLLEMRLNKYRLGDGVRGYTTPTGVCVDFADVIIALDIPVRLDKQSRRATGWAFDENRTIMIDRTANEEQIMNGTAAKVVSDDIRDTPEGWCVSTTALSRWLGVTLEADPGNALLHVRSGRKLPPELAAERRARIATTKRTPVFDLASLPQASAPYRGIRAPALDVVASIGGLRNRYAGSRIDMQYELYASGEAGPVAYDGRLSSDREGLPAALRLRAYRADPRGGLLGPLRATYAAVGDVQGVSTPLVTQSSAGRGALVTNRPLDRGANFDKTDFRGELPRGWDAELYRNGQLFAFANERADGRYEFIDVPLLYGQNRFEVVLYGPQGQTRREIKSVPVGLDSIPPKSTWYWAGINQDGHDLVELARQPSVRRGGWRGSMGVERGIDARTSFAAVVHSLAVEGLGRKSYAEASLRRAIGPALAEFSGSAELGGGYAMRGNVLGQLGTTYLSAETIWAKDFRSDRVLHDVTGLHSFTVDHAFGTGRGTIPVHFGAHYTTRGRGNSTLDASSRISANVGSLSLTGELGWRDERRNFGLDPRGIAEAGLLANARIGRLRLRGEARFELSPESRFESAGLVGEWSAGGVTTRDGRENDWRVEIGYDRELHRARAGLGYIRRFDRLALTTSVEAASDGSVAAGLSVAFSIGADPRRGGGMRVSADKLAAHGSTLVRVYRDANGNSRLDPGEPFEKNVQISAGRVIVERPTDANGEAIIDGLTPFQPLLIGIDAASLPDVLVQPSTLGLVVTPRPGIAVAIDLPLVSAGDIDGTLVRSGGGGLQGIDLELLDVEHRIAARAMSDFDGFFIFEGVPYGRYTLRIAALSASAARLDPMLAATAIVGLKTPSAHLGVVPAQPSVILIAGK